MIPIAVTGSEVLWVVVERAAPHHTLASSSRPHPPSRTHGRRALQRVDAVAFFQPPRRRPTSTTILDTCSYWPSDIQVHRWTNRRYTRSLASASSASTSSLARSSPLWRFARSSTSRRSKAAERRRWVTVCRWARGKWFVAGNSQVRRSKVLVKMGISGAAMYPSCLKTEIREVRDQRFNYMGTPPPGNHCTSTRP